MGANADCDRSCLPLVKSCCLAGTRGPTPLHEEIFVRFLNVEEQGLAWWQLRYVLGSYVSYGT